MFNELHVAVQFAVSLLAIVAITVVFLFIRFVFNATGDDMDIN
jgi:hypothetical protein